MKISQAYIHAGSYILRYRLILSNEIFYLSTFQSYSLSRLRGTQVISFV